MPQKTFHQLRRRAFLAGTAASSMVGTLPVLAGSPSTPDTAAIGPLLGHVDRNQALIWYRPAQAGQYQLQVFPAGVDPTDSASENSSTAPQQVLAATASPENDLCVTWRVTGLDPGLHYTAVVVSADGAAISGTLPCVIATAPEHNAAVRADLAFGSCASSTDFFDVWERMAAEGADGVVLLGDTPYIDRTELDINRSKHRQFLSIPTLQELCRTRPLWATWDDHDFGANDSDGRIKNKDLIRQAFTEYRALDYFGDGQHGIYTRFRRGPVEVFLMDPRYFSQTEPSPVDAQQPTCLGSTQWRWLLDGLKQSTATFKVLATGMIWDAKASRVNKLPNWCSNDSGFSPSCVHAGCSNSKWSLYQMASACRGSRRAWSSSLGCYRSDRFG